MGVGAVAVWTWPVAVLAAIAVLVVAGVGVAKGRRFAGAAGLVGAAAPVGIIVAAWTHCVWLGCADFPNRELCEDESGWCFLAFFVGLVVSALVWIPLIVIGIAGALRGAKPGSWWDRRWPTARDSEDAAPVEPGSNLRQK